VADRCNQLYVGGDVSIQPECLGQGGHRCARSPQPAHIDLIQQLLCVAAPAGVFVTFAEPGDVCTQPRNTRVGIGDGDHGESRVFQDLHGWKR
jgi:hypothetical protein